MSLKIFYQEDFFTIAHELGHYFLHKDWIEKGKYEILMRNTSFRTGNSLEKIEANTFAVHLLVPDFMLNKYKKVSSFYELSILFGVSQPVIKFRVEQGRWKIIKVK